MAFNFRGNNANNMNNANANTGNSRWNNFKSGASDFAGKVGDKVSDALNWTKETAKKGADKVHEELTKDKILTAEELAAVLETRRSAIEQFPRIQLNKVGSAGGVEKFTSTSLPYDLNVVDTIIDPTSQERFYVVQQQDKQSLENGKYAFVDADGWCQNSHTANGDLGQIFFVDYELIAPPQNGGLPVRARVNTSSQSQEVAVELGVQNAQVVNNQIGGNP